ncbi:MAG: threonine/serine dehydratase [Paraglaciecola sp.]|uniref:threonine/serine dehydratase n=1 Tax=Paraglaciecola sp. TaxID=1920173 RepID=UPI003265DCFB
MIIDILEIKEAADRIATQAVRTPIIESAQLNADTGARVLIKAECLQRSGSFKFRGAYNRLSQLSQAQRRAGVVAWSSGNHAQGIAAAAQILKIPATIVMPLDAPEIKMQKTKEYGAEIVTYDRYTQSREDIGKALSKERGATLVPSYDDHHIITGQGTVGLEFLEQSLALGYEIEQLLVCCGGGGLIAGTASAFSQLSPDTAVYSVEPDSFDDHKRSLISGTRESNAPDARSICDALLAPEPGSMTFPINHALLTAGLSVSDAEVRDAMKYAFSTLKLVIEPGGAVALAAVLAGKLDVKGKTVGVVVSGGNVDPVVFSESIL